MNPQPTSSLPLGSDLYQAVVHGMSEAVVVADREGIIRVWNRGAGVLFGFTPEEALGASLNLIVPERFRRAHDEGYRRTIASGHLRFEGRVMTTRSNHKFGCRLYVAFSFGLLKDADGTVQGVVAVGRDVTAEHFEEIAKKVREGQVCAT